MTMTVTEYAERTSSTPTEQDDVQGYLVVIAIIAIQIALLLPAVQKVREAPPPPPRG